MLPSKADDMWAFVTNHEIPLSTGREIIAEFRRLSVQRTVYNSKENAMVASNLIRHPGRQMKYPKKLFSTSPRCVNCLKLQWRLHTTCWVRGLPPTPGSRMPTYQHIGTKAPSESPEGDWAAFSQAPGQLLHLALCFQFPAEHSSHSSGPVPWCPLGRQMPATESSTLPDTAAKN